MTTNVTKINSIHIEKFRALNNIKIEFGDRITVICGKNGTAKSSILGIVAQTFNFTTDHTQDKKLSFKTLTGDPYKSAPRDHFRLSKTYDKSGTMVTRISMYDGYTNQDTEMQLKIYDYSDRPDPRPVMRGNKTIAGKKNTSWNPTHPVIYLSLKRLTPITLRDDYSAFNLKYLEEHKEKFLALNNALLNKRGTTRATATTGSIKSAVAHGDNYDQDAVSAGEDNAGQIILALLSFRKLKEEYSDYKGGLLLIDEADAGLFPAAQISLIKILAKECKDLNLQVIMTSHSPTMIEEIYNYNLLARNDYKTIYLSDTHGAIERYENWSWQDIYADLHTKTVDISNELHLPQINIYFEDKEACDLFNAIVTKRTIKKLINQFKAINLGCKQYETLIKHKIPEFTTKSLIVLDGDATEQASHESVILLPSDLPPDQLIFEFLYNLPDDDPFWKNSIKFNKPVFRRIASPIISRLNLKDETIKLDKLTKSISGAQPPIRDLFKNFYNDPDIQKIIHAKAKENLLKVWCARNQAACNEFNTLFSKKIKSTLIKGYGVDAGKLAFLDS